MTKFRKLEAASKRTKALLAPWVTLIFPCSA